MQRPSIHVRLLVQFLLSEDKTSLHVRQQDMFDNNCSLTELVFLCWVSPSSNSLNHRTRKSFVQSSLGKQPAHN